jgi:sporulation protein YlmC with PRC-barrel domain
MKTKELYGREVLDSDAKNIGKVIDVDFDMHQGVINHIIVKAGALKQYEVSFEEITVIGDRMILRVAENQLKRKTVIAL